MNGNGADRLVEVVVLSRNDPITGLRVGRSIEENRFGYSQRHIHPAAGRLSPIFGLFGAHLFLSALAEDVKAAIDKGFAAAHVMGGGEEKKDEKDEVLESPLTVTPCYLAMSPSVCIKKKDSPPLKKTNAKRRTNRCRRGH